MQIQLKLNEDFERFLDELRIKYGSDFEKLNGFSENNFNLSEFIYLYP